MSLEELRNEIDEADDKIVRLIAERIRIAEEIGKEKKKLGKQIEDTAREKVVLENIKSIAKDEKISQEGIERVYRQIISTSKSAEGIQVAFQGELGAYSEEATFQYFGPSVQPKPCESVDDVFRTVMQGKTQFGIVPIENSIEGSISRSYDQLLDSELRVQGETELRVVHCLIANPKTRLDAVRRVYSHPQALGQCQTYLKHLGCELVPTYDTAGSVKLIKEQKITDGAAIASARSAEIYGMQIISKGIEDNQSNRTRFFILAGQDSPPSGNDKTSIVFSVKHQPGALYDFLKTLALRKINLTKIESRPRREKPWEYNFYLDFEGHREDKAIRETLEELEKTALFLKILGSYPKAK
ncbi:prephenate dehydratase [Chloroflexota bacterium]